MDELTPQQETSRSAVRWIAILVAAAVPFAIGLSTGRDLTLEAAIPQEWSFAPLVLMAIQAAGVAVAIVGLLVGLATRFRDAALVLLAIGAGLAAGAILGQVLA